MQKIGECYFRDDDGNLWIAESFCDKLGVVTTRSTQIQEQDKKYGRSKIVSIIKNNVGFILGFSWRGNGQAWI